MDNSKEVVLDANQSLKIKPITNGEPLQSTKVDKIDAYDYRNYRFQGVVFSVKEDEGFYEALLGGNVFETTLRRGTREVTVDGEKIQKDTIEFDSFISAKQKIGVVNMLGGIKKLEREYAAPIAAPKLEQALA